MQLTIQVLQTLAKHKDHQVGVVSEVTNNVVTTNRLYCVNCHQILLTFRKQISPSGLLEEVERKVLNDHNHQ